MKWETVLGPMLYYKMQGKCMKKAIVLGTIHKTVGIASIVTYSQNGYGYKIKSLYSAQHTICGFFQSVTEITKLKKI